MKGLKPSKWAEKVGVSRNVVANIHGGTQQKPSLEYIAAVSRSTGRSMNYLLWGEEEEEEGSGVGVMPAVASARTATVLDPLGIARSMELLAKIYAADDAVYIRAISANLMAFADAVETKARANDLENRMREMEKDLADMKGFLAKLKQEEASEKARLRGQSSGKRAA